MVSIQLNKFQKQRKPSVFSSKFLEILKIKDFQSPRFKFESSDKKAQVTLFIILALGISVVAVLLFTGKGSIQNIFVQDAPIDQIKICIKDSLAEGINLLSVQGGSINPENYYLYEGNKVDYLCYSNQYYAKCVMQKPLLKNSIESELGNYIKPRVLGCMNSVKSSLEKQGYSITFKEPEIIVNLVPNSILVDIDSDLQITKSGTETYKSFKTDYDSKLYDLVMISSSIADWEASYGDTEVIDYMAYYPSLKVEKIKQDDGTKIYILTNRNSLDKFMFAVRSVALPAGVIG